VEPFDINDAGQVVGHYSPGFNSGISRAFLYSGGRFEDLGPLVGDSSTAWGVSGSGDVVGWSSDWATGVYRPFLYGDGVVRDLQDLIPAASGWALRTVYAISSNGRMVGAGRHDGRQAAFVMTPDQPPTADAGGPYVVDEGGAMTVTGSGTDPDGLALTYEWDLDGNGSFEAAGQSVTFDAAGHDGPSTHKVTLRVTDAGGLSATAEATVEIRNVAPTADLSSAPATLYPGESATLGFGNPADPGEADVLAGFRYAFDCTADGAFEVVDSVQATYPCVYASAGSFTARGRITDKDGGSTLRTTPVVVVSPGQGVQGLIDDVGRLIGSGILSPGQGGP
jgi:probable HAF family extracellular repeat protein